MNQNVEKSACRSICSRRPMGLPDCTIMVVEMNNGRMIESGTMSNVPLLGDCPFLANVVTFANRTYKCTICKYKSKKKGNVDAHILVHCKCHHFQCSSCGYKFQSRAVAFNHVTGRRRS